MNFFERAALTLRSGIGGVGPTVAVSTGPPTLSPSATGGSTSSGASQSPSMSSIGAHLSDGEARDGDTDDDVTDTEDDSGIVDHHHHRQHSQRQHRLELAERAKRFFPDLGIDESMAGQQGTTLNSFLTYW